MRRRAAVFAGAVVSLVLLAAAGQAYAASDVYVAAQGANRADEFSIGSTGALTPFGSVATGSIPDLVAVGVHTQGLGVKVTSVYVTNDVSNTVSQYTVASNGTLTPKSPATVATGTSPVGVAVSPNGNNVYVTNSSAGTVSQYSVGTGGTLVPKSPATVPAGADPNGIALSPNGKNAYVANGGSGTVSEYAVASNGSLLSLGAVAAGGAPRFVAVTQNSADVYVTNENSNTVSQYSAASNGTLTPKSPATVATGRAPFGIAAGQSKLGLATVNSVYVINFAGDTVSQFTVGTGGNLVPKSPATVATGLEPTGVALNAGTHSAYVSNYGGNTVSQYTVAPGGALSANGTVATDTHPLGIAVKK